MSGIWQVLNSWLIAIIDWLAPLWPSTPSGMKLGTLLATMHTYFPLAPWYLVGRYLPMFLFVVGAVTVVKLWQTFKW